MVNFEQISDMPTAGSDCTATYHKIEGKSYMYIWLGRSSDVVRLDLADFTYTIEDSSPPVTFEQGKVLNPNPGENTVFLTPRDDEDGGNTDSIGVDTVVEISVPDLTYTGRDSIPESKGVNPFGLVQNGEMYFWNYRDDNGNHVSDIYRISSTGGLTRVADSGNAYFNGAAGILDGTVYQFGGSNDSGSNTSNIYTVDLERGGSTKVADMTYNGSSLKLDTHFGRFFGDFFYSFGGREDDGTTRDEVWKIDIETGELSVLATMAEPALDIITGYDGSQLWAFGGRGEGGGGDELAYAYRLIRTREGVALLVSEELGIQGVFEDQGDQALLHSDYAGRAELNSQVGDDVVVVSEEFAQS